MIAASDPVSAEKAACRSRLIADRASLDAGLAAQFSREAAGRLLELVDAAMGPVVSAFWSLPGEIDTQPVLEGLSRLGIRTALPVIQGRGKPLRFHSWAPGDVLLPGPMKVMQPAPTTPEILPTIVLTPLLAFDAEGYRLGWGGGFYDRTIQQLRDTGMPVLVVGYAFSRQEVDHVPRDVFDQRLDMIVTERETRSIG